MKQPKKTILKESWVWNDTISEFIKNEICGYSINICAGKNPICDVNIDLDPKDKSVLKGDMRIIPFSHETFDTVISDPPWKISYYERFIPFFECVRICKIGGKIIYNATWIPESTDVILERVYVRQDNSFTNTSIISIFRKTKSNPYYENRMEPKIHSVKQHKLTQLNNKTIENYR